MTKVLWDTVALNTPLSGPIGPDPDERAAMKGVIFNAVENSVERVFGPDAWDEVLDRADVGGAYTSLGNYQDIELVAIVNALPDDTGPGLDDRLRWVGINAMPFLQESFPRFFEDIELRGFLPSLNHMIHPEVRKLYPGANPPDFDIDYSEAGVISLRYQSERKLCWLAEGFVLGASAAFDEPVTVKQPTCMHDGADHCDLRIELHSA